MYGTLCDKLLKTVHVYSFSFTYIKCDYIIFRFGQIYGLCTMMSHCGTIHGDSYPIDFWMQKEILFQLTINLERGKYKNGKESRPL